MSPARARRRPVGPPSGGARDRRRLDYFELADSLARVHHAAALQEACGEVARRLGYARYLYGAYFPSIERMVLSTTYPDEWRRRYEERGYAAVDPVVRHCARAQHPVRWRDVEVSEGRVGALERQVMEEGAAHGLRSGLSVPIHGAGAEGGMLSLASSREYADLERHEDAGLLIVAHAMHEATRTVFASGSEARRDEEELTPRESETLSALARGLSAADAAAELDITPDTFAWHVKNASRKLRVTNRSAAVGKALALGRITLF